jgi:mono/diheme cytochrome c family protein
MQTRIRYIWYLLPVLFGFFLVGALLTWRNGPFGEPITINGITVPPAPTLDPDLIAQGELLYSQYCASCHGAKLEGAPEWKTVKPDGKLPPPPHDSSGHTWHHPDDLLFSIISEGGDPSNSNMPAYGIVLTESEMLAIMAFIKSSWGQKEREFQWWITVKNE